MEELQPALDILIDGELVHSSRIPLYALPTLAAKLRHVAEELDIQHHLATPAPPAGWFYTQERRACKKGEFRAAFDAGVFAVAGPCDTPVRIIALRHLLYDAGRERLISIAQANAVRISRGEKCSNIPL